MRIPRAWLGDADTDTACGIPSLSRAGWGMQTQACGFEGACGSKRAQVKVLVGTAFAAVCGSESPYKATNRPVAVAHHTKPPTGLRQWLIIQSHQQVCGSVWQWLTIRGHQQDQEQALGNLASRPVRSAWPPCSGTREHVPGNLDHTQRGHVSSNLAQSHEGCILLRVQPRRSASPAKPIGRAAPTLCAKLTPKLLFARAVLERASASSSPSTMNHNMRSCMDSSSLCTARVPTATCTYRQASG